MYSKPIMRFNTYEFAKAVLHIARQLSVADFQLERKPPGEADTKRGVGDYVIVVSNNEELGYSTIDRLHSVIDAAVLYAVCDELQLACSNGSPFLRGMWKLRPENREQVYANARNLEQTHIVGPFRDRKACREI